METVDLDDVRMALKELVIGLNSSCEDQLSPEEIKESLMNLEENDEHFHRFHIFLCD